MAKQKTKAIPFENKAAEVQPGIWEFTKNGHTWQFREVMGLNLFYIKGDQAHVVCRVKNIEQAGVFAEGFSAGADFTNRAAASTLPLAKA